MHQGKTQRREQEGQAGGDHEQTGSLGHGHVGTAVHEVCGQCIRHDAGEHSAAEVVGGQTAAFKCLADGVGQPDHGHAQHGPAQVLALPLCALRGQLGGVCPWQCHGQHGGALQRGFLVDLFDLLRHGFWLEAGFVTLSRGLSEALAQVGILQQLCQGVGDVGGVVLDQPTVFAMLDHFGNAGQPCGDDGHAAAHGFEDGDRQALMVRQEHENLVLCQLFGHVAHIAGPFNVSQALCAGAQLVSGAIGAIAQQACGGFQVLPAQ